MPYRALLALNILCLTVAFAQTKVHLGTQARAIDFSAASTTKPLKVGGILPPQCTIGEFLFNFNQPPGAKVFACTAINTWTLQGGSTLPPASGNSGAVLSTDGLNVTWRPLDGDVTGTPAVNSVVRLRNRPISAAVPQNGQALIWNAGTGAWEPQAVTSGGSGALEVRSSGTVIGSRSRLNLITGPGLIQTLSDTGTQIDFQQNIDTAIIATRAEGQSGRSLLCSSAGNSATDFTCALSPALTTYTTGMTVHWRPDVDAAAGAVTLNVDTLAAKPVKRSDGVTDPLPGDIRAGRLYVLWYDGAAFRFTPRVQRHEEHRVLARCLNDTPVSGDVVSVPSTGAASFSCSAGNPLQGTADFPGTGLSSLKAVFWLPADFATGSTASLSVSGIAAAAGAYRFSAQTSCRGAAGTSASPAFNTAQVSSAYAASGATLETGVLSWGNLTMTGCAPSRQLLISLDRDNTVSGNGGLFGAFALTLTIRREVD